MPEGQKVQSFHVRVGLSLGDRDGHGIKVKTHSQVSSCALDTTLGFLAVLTMD